MQRILVIDDDPTLTSVLRRGLSYEGFTVDTAATGLQGLTIARDHAPNLVILDVMLPGIDGFEVLRRLRSADENLPVLMLTARRSPLPLAESDASSGNPPSPLNRMWTYIRMLNNAAKKHQTETRAWA